MTKVVYYHDVDGKNYDLRSLSALLAEATQEESHQQLHRYEVVYDEVSDVLAGRCVWCGRMSPDGPGVVFGSGRYFMREE